MFNSDMMTAQEENQITNMYPEGVIPGELTDNPGKQAGTAVTAIFWLIVIWLGYSMYKGK